MEQWNVVFCSLTKLAIFEGVVRYRYPPCWLIKGRQIRRAGGRVHPDQGGSLLCGGAEADQERAERSDRRSLAVGNYRQLKLPWRHTYGLLGMVGTILTISVLSLLR